MRISQKLPLVTVLSVLLSVSAIGVTSYVHSADALRAAAEAKLVALMEVRKAALADYLASIQQDLRIKAGNPETIAALKSFSAAWRQIRGDKTETLQRLYITDNPYPQDRKALLDAAPDGSAYSRAHARYHPWFRTFLHERGYYDIFLFDLDGNLIYTVFKELDFATNLNEGPWSDTDLGNAFRAARDNARLDQHAFFDFRPYPPSHDAPASFIATSIYDADGRKLGVLAFQMPIANINRLMRATVGMGETGETLLVGADGLARSESRFIDATAILKREVRTAPVAAALTGKTGVTEARNHDGHDVISAYAPIDFLGVRWALLAEANIDEVFSATREMRNQMLVFALAILLGIGAVGFAFARSISRPIVAMTTAMRDLAAGDRTIEVPALERTDEIGAMAKAVQVFKETAIEADHLNKEAARDQARIAKRASKVESLCGDFERSVEGVLYAVSAASVQMQSTAESMASTATQTAAQAKAVAGASTEAIMGVQSVASTTDELSVSVNEISQRVTQSSEIAASAVQETKRVTGTVQGLADTATEIGQLIDLINDVAEQTNLLVVNTTIESARAGETDGEFAAAASEVETLASQTAGATEKIAAQITRMQAETSNTAAAIEKVRNIVEQMDRFSAAIAAAVEEQSAATMDMARNAEQAASGAEAVFINIAGVSDAASQTGEAANRVLSSSGRLSDQADVLRRTVEMFLESLRAA